MTAGAHRHLDIELSDRDQAVLVDLARVRLLTGDQLERLHFTDLSSSRTRANVRWRVLKRLIELNLVTTLQRRVGGVRAGSAGLIYTLDSVGQRRAALVGGHSGARVRRPWAIGSMFVAHTLDVAELYVRLREQERLHRLRLVDFDAEPASWHRTGYALLKPDAHAVWETPAWEQHRWIEVDRGTESLPTLRRKLMAYVDAAGSGDQGPSGVLPRVLVTVPSDKRLVDVRGVIKDLPPPGSDLIEVELFDAAFRLDIPTERPPPWS